jgi:hypothetical protein
MNRRGFITSALKGTAAGLLVPEHLFGRSMVAGFWPQTYSCEEYPLAIDIAEFKNNPDYMATLRMLELAFGKDTTVIVSPALFPGFEKAYRHIINVRSELP